jgi:putative transcriptional regulator
MLKSLREALDSAGFSITEKLPASSSIFDIIAKRDKLILITKVLVNIDSFRYENSIELRCLAQAIEALPILVGERCTACNLEDCAIYVRHSIPVMNCVTFIDYVKNDSLPLVYAAPGGLYARIDGDTLKKLREERNISISTIAERAGVSRKAITLYEHEEMGASIDVVSKIEEFFDVPLTLPIDPEELFQRFSSFKDILKREPETEVEHTFFSLLKELGYEVSSFRKAPIDAVVSRKEKALSEFDGSSLKEKVEILSEVTDVVEKEGVIFSSRIKKESFRGIAVISSEDLEHADDIFELIEKKKKR